jgi:hypothetical protein
LSPTANKRNDAEVWNTWRNCWPLCGSTPTPAAKPLSTTPCGEQRIAKLCAAHTAAYNASKHVEVIRLTPEINALRGLIPKRPIDFRDDHQRDVDEERADGWVCGR